LLNIITNKELFLKTTKTEEHIIFQYRDGRSSSIPSKNFFVNYLGGIPDFGSFYIGISSGVGIGSQVKFDGHRQLLTIGNYFSGGWNTKFILNGMHNMNTPSQVVLGTIPGMQSQPVEDLGNITLKHDVWFGDEVVVMGGVTINNGCVVGARTIIPPRKELEAYGVYVGNPAKLIKFRFPPDIIELLEELKWWEKPLTWLQDNADFMHLDLNEDITKSKEILRKLISDDVNS